MPTRCRKVSLLWAKFFMVSNLSLSLSDSANRLAATADIGNCVGVGPSSSSTGRRTPICSARLCSTFRGAGSSTRAATRGSLRSCRRSVAKKASRPIASRTIASVAAPSNTRAMSAPGGPSAARATPPVTDGAIATPSADSTGLTGAGATGNNPGTHGAARTDTGRASSSACRRRYPAMG